MGPINKNKSYVLDDDDDDSSSEDDDRALNIRSPMKKIETVIIENGRDGLISGEKKINDVEDVVEDEGEKRKTITDADNDDDDDDDSNKEQGAHEKKSNKVDSESSDSEPDWMKEYKSPVKTTTTKAHGDDVAVVEEEEENFAKRKKIIDDDNDKDSPPSSSDDGWSDDEKDVKPLAVRLSEKKQKEVMMIDDDDSTDSDVEMEDAKEKQTNKKEGQTTTTTTTNITPTKKRKEPPNSGGNNNNAFTVGANIPKSKVPLFVNHAQIQKTKKSLVLFECKGSGEAVDLSGDVGVVGRLLVEREEQPSIAGTSKHQQQQQQSNVKVDLKGIMYLARTNLLSSSVAIINVGVDNAKIETIFDDYVQLREDPSAENVACVGNITNDNYIPLEPGDEGFEEHVEEKRKETKATKAAAKKKPAKKKPAKRKPAKKKK